MITLGESRVRTNFNPSNNDLVDQIKQKTAELINLVDTLRDKDDGMTISSEQYRLIILAQTVYEEAAMWSVKAATSN